MQKMKAMPTTLPDMIRLHESVALLDREIVQPTSVLEISVEPCGADMSENRGFAGRTRGYPELWTVATRSGEDTAVQRRRLHHKAVYLENFLRVGLSFKALLVEHGSPGQSSGAPAGGAWTAACRKVCCVLLHRGSKHVSGLEK
jgi:hypothetical protein